MHVYTQEFDRLLGCSIVSWIGTELELELEKQMPVGSDVLLGEHLILVAQ